MPSKILIVDDEENIRETIGDILKDEGYQVVKAADGEEALRRIQIEDADTVILDVMLPGKGGLEVLDNIHRDYPLLPALIISGHGNIKMAVEAMRRGAFDFIEKPLSMERIISSVRNAIKFKELMMENLNLKSRLDKPPVFIGESAPVKAILAKLPQIAQSDASVLITGENGTGKEVIARLVHSQSPRRKESFVSVNCAAIPDTLIESELFGYEKGAFTGAVKQKKGKFESAHGGTLFLDEIGDLSLSAQAKVLRVIQERELERLGGNGAVRVDVRLVAATNKDLALEIREGRFRQDLFYRLNVLPIMIPPLRERPEDIAALVRFFLEELEQKNGRSTGITRNAMQLLSGGKWPGNVRELRNFVERLVILTVKPEIDADDVLRQSYPEESSVESKYEDLNLKDAKREFERGLILNRLIRNGLNITRTAESLGIERTYLHKKIKELGLDDMVSGGENPAV